ADRDPAPPGRCGRATDRGGVARAVARRRVLGAHRSRCGRRGAGGGRLSTASVKTGRLPTVERSRVAKEMHDGRYMIGRNLIAYKRVPQLLVFSTIQPIIFVLMFRYVFGGVVGLALPPSIPYVDYLMPGIFVQTGVFGSLAAGRG